MLCLSGCEATKAAGLLSFLSLFCNFSSIFSLEKIPTLSFTEDIKPLSVVASSLLSSLPAITASLLPAQAIVIAVSSAPAGFMNTVILSIQWFFQACHFILEHKLYSPAKEHVITSLFKDLYLMLV
ncbi:uncharacterized protein CIMG_12613 [Coccidioides immitis RS]|uniref:Uncharacterized protein n=1 Tax=Coccidioides immitis (strain RS) TaxID=246410 RepID=J3KMC7_COCIM|nr:uncharacterized protein CIMG_12613 [Coccidioides immitis RS]EAS37554.3 hypothetical protein CIMG_12613 [Coccidioides immitis RS]